MKKYARFESSQILDVKGSSTQVKNASLNRLSDFDDYRTEQGYLYMRCRAISSRVNRNWDAWPSVELAGDEDTLNQHLGSDGGFTVEAKPQAKYGFSTFLGKPIFVDHNNHNPQRARGVVVDAKLHVEDRKTASELDPYYATAEDDFHPPTWVELLLEIDAQSFPKLAKAIIDGSKDPNSGLDGVSMGCFIPGTLITLSDGTQKPIELIQENDEVLTHTGKTETVTYTMKRPHNGVVYSVDVYGQAKPLTMTEEHPVWVRRIPTKNAARKRKWEPDGGVCTCGRSFDTRTSFGAHLREVNKRGENGHSQSGAEILDWIEAQDLRIGDYVLTPASRQTNHPGTYTFARLLGYYLAEGNLGHDRKRFPDGRPAFVEWNFHEDEVEYINEVTTLIAQSGYQPAGPYVKNHCASIRCNSPEFATQFKSYGGVHSHLKQLHPDVLGWDTENQRALLFAYFNGDGHLTDRHVQASTASHKLAQQLHVLALRCEVPMTPPGIQHSPSAQKVGNQPKYVMQAVLDPVEQREYLAFADKQGLWRRITNIAIKEYDGHVYNFDVHGDDSYVAGDIAVHNCDIEYSRCSHCSNIASAPDDFCKHVKRKGSSFSYIDSKTGKKRSKKSFEFCHKVGFFELSVVFEPADETALTREVISSIHKEGEETDLPRTDQTKVPEEVNTLRDETLCPVCATQMDGIECPTCSYIKPPENLDNPDLDKVQDNTQALRDEQGTPEETSAKKQLGDAEDDDEDGSLPPANKPMKQVGSLALNGERSIWSVTNKMSAKGTRRSKLANRRVAADPLPAARPDVSTEVEPVGGVMNANNESGSAADSQVSLTDVGGTPTDSVSPDETDAVDSGNEYTKNIESIPSKTFPNENQHTPVDAQPFPPSDEGVKPGPAPKKTNWHVVAYGPAVEGVDPSDPVGRAEQRVDVTDVDYTVPLQSTETWTGTDGNGVLRQQDPTTSDPWPASEDGVKASGIRMADLQLVDREIDMGITDSAQKYTRLAELSQKPAQIVEATLEELSRVKTAGLSKSAGTSQRGMRMPSLNKTASRDAPADDFLLDSAVFSK